MPLFSVTLIGVSPPESTTETSATPLFRIAKVDSVLLAAFTTKAWRPSLLSVTAPCEPSPAPVPWPWVGTRATSERSPPCAGAKTSSSLPPGALVLVNTLPSRNELSWSWASAGKVAATATARVAS